MVAQIFSTAPPGSPQGDTLCDSVGFAGHLYESGYFYVLSSSGLICYWEGSYSCEKSGIPFPPFSAE